MINTVLSISVKQNFPKNKMYVDLNVLFTDNSNEPVCTEDTRSIVQSLDRLFNTRIGSVPFNRSYGSSLWNLLFENENIETYQVEMLLFQEIQTWEPRVKISPSSVTVSRMDEHNYKIGVTFTVPELNNLTGQVTTTVTE